MNWATFSLLAAIAALLFAPAGAQQQQFATSIDEEGAVTTPVVDLPAVFSDLSSVTNYFLALDTPPDISMYFSVGASSGLVTTKSKIDRELLNETLKNQLVFRVICEPGPKQKTITVKVNDINDNLPSFPDIDPNNQTIEENAATGKTIFSPSAYDADIGNNTVKSATLIDGDPEGKFSLHFLPYGDHRLRIWVQLKKELDRETQEYYQLEIKVSEGVPNPNVATLLWNITVKDVNDNAPEFNFSTYDFDVPENSDQKKRIGRVEATDADKDPSLLYSIVGQNTKPPFYLGSPTVDLFVIDSRTGELTLQKSLDYEQSHKLLSLGIRVYDGKFEDTAVVNVHVLDVNDNTPIISPLATTPEIDEGSLTVGASPVAVLRIEDKDAGVNKNFTWNLLGSFGDFSIERNAHGFFLISQTKELDRETRPQYTLTVNASDRGTPVLSTTWSMVVTVKDMNDNRPSFENTPYSASLKESVPSGTSVVRVTASDPDESLNGAVSLFIPKGQPFGDWFTIDSSGLVNTNGSLDRELKSMVKLIVTARDQGTPPLESNITISIIIEDVNDNTPQFNQGTYLVNVSEASQAGISIDTITATDSDEGSWGNVTYSLIGGDLKGVISIDPRSGVLTLVKTLDREKQQQYSGSLRGTDGGGKESTVGLTIKVVDINDNIPLFYPVDYDCFIYENASIGHECTKVEATDEDENPGVQYQITSGNKDQKFSLNPQTGMLVTNQSLDKEEMDSYKLTIRAEDSDGRSSKQDATVRITVANVIDKPPLFNQTHYMYSVNETSPSGVLIGSVYAVNQDFGLNGTMEYLIGRGDPDGHFKVDTVSGVITLSKSVDREKTPSFGLEIEARCCGSNPLLSTVLVNVSVQDANDNFPVFGFTSGDLIPVKENLPQGTLVVNAKAVDSDFGPNGELMYTMTSEIPGLFEIDAQNGSVVLLKSLDYEKMKRTSINVTAQDHGNPPKKTKIDVIISVVDTNDHSPVFSQKDYHASVLENTTTRVAILNVSASDKDSGLNGEIAYKLESFGRLGLPFNVWPNGEIYIDIQLDAEKVKNYSFEVVAVDRGSPPNTASALVVVDVLDVNDNSPEFVKDQDFKFYLTENVPLGFQIGAVSATDKDSGRNSAVTYAWEKPSSVFMIDQQTGVITTKGDIDREQSDFHSLVVVASDDGNPSQSTSAIITISVSDENDNSPMFAESGLISSWVWENAAVNDSFDRVIAVDPDDGENGTVTFSIQSAIPSDDISIDAFLGSLVIHKPLDRERTPFYELNVTAADGGTPPRRSWKSVRVIVGDRNDNTPIFENASIVSLTISEAVPLHSSLAHFKATDKDNGTNSQLVYAIDQGNVNSYFSMDPDTGILRNAKSLDYETLKNFTLTIQATDQSSSHPLSASVQASIRVTDANDHSPQFQNLPWSKSIYDDAPVRTSVYHVNAHDSDSGVNGKFLFSVIGQDPPPLSGQPMHFGIDSDSGIVRVIQSQFGRVTSFKVTIQAQDQAVPVSTRLASNATLTVSVFPADSAAVRFTSKNTTEIGEDTDVGSFIIDVNANSGSGRLLVYSLVDGNVGGKFELSNGPLGGVLKLKRKLDREVKDSYVLTIQASDEGKPPRIGVLSLTVIVLDVNDNPPDFGQSKFAVNVTQGEAPGTLVVKMNAQDDDLGLSGNVSYSIIAGNGGGLFDIDNRTGAITLLKSPMNPGRLTLSVQAEDMGTPSLVSTADVTVDILVPEQPPDFLKPAYAFDITENEPANTTVGFVHANDVAGRPVRYSIVNSTGPGVFFITSTGEIFARFSLDSDKTPSYQLVVEAYPDSDPSQRSSVNVVVNVVNINDNSPVFERPYYTAFISETASSGEYLIQVTAQDADRGKFGELRYRLDGADSVFVVDPLTGLIRLAGTLDRERKSSYVFLVWASEIVANNRSTSAPVQVQVLDSNDNHPVFAQSIYSVNISSGAPGGTPVVQVLALDADGGANGTVSYSISPKRPEFQVDSTSGLLTTNSSLQPGQSYQFSVVAEDEGTPAMASYANVTVRSVDPTVHQLPPRFLQPLILRTLPENSGLQFSVTQVEAVSDTPSAVITYDISAGDSQGVFIIGSTSGRLVLASSLDAATEDHYSLVIQAKEMASPSLVAEAHVIINVTTVSSDLSKFINPRSGQVSENQPRNTSVLTVTACSPFLPQSKCNTASINYYLEPTGDSKFFTIGQTSGVLRTNDDFDAEQKRFYDVVVSAVDLSKSGQSGSATIQVLILDDNDNSPFFYPSSNVSIAENTTTGTVIGSVNARDDDVTSQLVYYFEKGSDNKFAIDSKTGEISLQNSVDYESRSVYPLTVAVSDGNHQARTNFFVFITDINDNAPKFSQSLYMVSIKERERIGSLVVDVNATDKDSVSNADIRYSLGSPSDDGFYIDLKTGILRLNKSVVYESGQRNSYVVTVVAADDGQPSLSSSATVTIHVDDLNDHRPYFSMSDYTFDVALNLAAGTTVGRLTATDLDDDENGEIRFEMIGGNGSTAFVVERLTGNVVYVSGGSTFKESQIYRLRVRAVDLGTIPGSLSNETNVSIVIVSARQVKFVKDHYDVSVNETAPKNTDVVQVKAVIMNSGGGAIIKYGFKNPTGDFAIDSSSGKIKTQTKLDYSKLSSYQLTVVAKDEDSSSEDDVDVLITVRDVNDNAPVFLKKTYQGDVLENSGIGLSVLTVSATDDDGKSNSALNYSVNSEYFNVDSHGVITVKVVPDYETTNHYEFTVTAEDSGTEKMSGSADVVVNVLPQNEFHPRFTSSQFEFTVPTNVKTGTTIGVVTASDDDHGKDGELEYFFKDIKKAQLSNLEMKTVSNQGQIIYNASLNPNFVIEDRRRREARADNSFVVVAADKGPTPQTSTTGIVVTFGTLVPLSVSKVPVIAGAVGGLLFLTLLLFLIFFLYRCREKKRRQTYTVASKEKGKKEIIFMTNPAHSQEMASLSYASSREVGIDEAVERSLDISLANGHSRARSQDRLLLANSPRDSLSSSADDRHDGSDESNQLKRKVRLTNGFESETSESAIHKDIDVSLPSTVAHSRTASEAGSGYGTLQKDARNVMKDVDPRTIMKELAKLGLDGSRESMHDYNLQGGGEAEVDLDNMLHSRLAEVDADEDDAIIDGTRTYTYEGASDTVTMTPSVASFSVADDDTYFYRSEYDHPYYPDMSTRSRNPPPGPAPVRPSMPSYPSPSHPSPSHNPQFYRNAPMPAHGRRPGAPPAASRSRPAVKALRNNGLSPCISPNVSVSSSLAVTPNETPAPSNLSPIASPTTPRTVSPSLSPSHSSLSMTYNS